MGATFWYIRDEQRGEAMVISPFATAPLVYRRFLNGWQSVAWMALPGDNIGRVIIDQRGEPRVLSSIPVVA